MTGIAFFRRGKNSLADFYKTAERIWRSPNGTDYKMMTNGRVTIYIRRARADDVVLNNKLNGTEVKFDKEFK